jgi:CspA family cold shock protein
MIPNTTGSVCKETVMPKGSVKWFDPKKGFGFVINEQGQDVFVHYTSIDRDGFRCLRNGQTVEYEQVASDKGLQGKNVRIVETAPQTAEKTPKKQKVQDDSDEN